MASKNLFKMIAERIKEGAAGLWRPLLAAVIIGIATGLIGSGLWLALDWCTKNFEANPFLIWLLPAGGIAIALVYRSRPQVGGTDQVLEAVRGKSVLSPLMVPMITSGTILTRFFGGSVGSEGAAIQIGGGIAAMCSRWLKVSEAQARIVIMSGISGGFASVVGTPVTAIMLAIELTGVGVMFYEAILPCSVSCSVSFTIASALGVSFPHYSLGPIPAANIPDVIRVIVLGVLCGLASILVCQSYKYAKILGRKLVENSFARAIAGGLLLACLTWLIGTTSFNGGGLNLVEDAVSGKSQWWTFLVKTAFTALTIGAGYRGGTIVPTLAVGASFGGFFGPLLGLTAPLGAGLGMTAVFCGAINCPMTAFVLGIETFGLGASLYFILSCAVAYIASGYYSLYSAQVIVRSKTASKIIDRTPL